MITLRDIKTRQELEESFAEAQRETEHLTKFEAFRQGYLQGVYQLWEKQNEEQMKEVLRNPPNLDKLFKKVMSYDKEVS